MRILVDDEGVVEVWFPSWSFDATQASTSSELCGGDVEAL